MRPNTKSAISNDRHIVEVRLRVLDRVFPIFAAIGSIGLVAGARDPILDRNWLLVGIYLVLLAAIISPLLIKSRNVSHRMAVLVLSLAALGFSELWFFGFASLAYMALYSSLVVIAFLEGGRIAAAWLGLSSVGIWAVAWIYSTGQLDMSSHQRQLGLTLIDWVGPYAGYLTISISTILFIHVIFSSLKKSLAANQEFSDVLTEKNQELTDAVGVLNAIIKSLPGVHILWSIPPTDPVRIHPGDTGYSETELEHLDADSLVHGKENKALVHQTFADIAASKGTRQVQLPVIHKDQSVHDYLFNVTYLEIKGQPHFSAIGIDTSEVIILKKLNSQLSAARRNLSEKNTELENVIRELRESQDRLIVSERQRLVYEFLSGLAHEVNTPLGNAVISLSHAMEQIGPNQCDEDIIEVLGLSTQNVRKAVQILQRMNGLRSHQLEIKEINLDEIVTLAIAECDWPHHIHAQVEMNDLTINTDSAIVVRSVKELLNNIAEHAYPTKSDGLKPEWGQMRVTGGADPENPDWAMITVKDWGQGIPEDDLHSLRSPFYSKRRSRGHQGSGLGLHLVDIAVCQLLGGRFTITSTEGQGTVVQIGFPRSSEEVSR